MVQQHPEGIVRKEAVTVLSEISTHQKINEEFKNLMHNIMYNAALNDLYWEVQLAALSFWKKTIDTHFSYRGMIDGKFPSMTFSKEKRKIITLNREEIHKQLISILNSLALNGCLSVLTKCMNEDYNIKVMEQSYNIAKDLLEILRKYSFNVMPETAVFFPTTSNNFIPKNEPNCNNIEMNIKSESFGNRSFINEYVPMDLSFTNYSIAKERIIEEIMCTNHTELINQMYNNHVEIKYEGTEEEVLRNIKTYDVIHPNEFIDKFTKNDFTSIIQEKKNWNSGEKDLNYILDEVISICEISDHVEPECI